VEPEHIRPRQFFQLRSGDVIRVNSIEFKKVHCDRFDVDAKQWVPVKTSLPTWTLYAPCEDPTKIEPKVSTIRRWWNSRKRLSTGG
jgi:hypothetical protein